MSHFLARLVERARGSAARVEPVVTPRFAPTPIVEVASELEAPPPERRDQQRTGEENSSLHAVPQKEAPDEKAEPNTRDWEKLSPPQQPEQLLVPVEAGATDSMSLVRPSTTARSPVPVIKNGIVRTNSFTPSRSKRSRPTTSVKTTSRNRERDLLRPNESSEQPPIVRVTIGRIDVRATTPAVPSRKPSPRSEPKLTLDAYLKSRREGTR